MPRLKLTLAYVGTHYHGWQIQAWKDRPHPPTVQAEVERAVNAVAARGGTGEIIHVQGAGRTDSGVHADGQVAHCDIPDHRAGIDWRRALNTLLPRDIRVVDARLVPDGFDACFSAVRKAYTYRLWLDPRFTPPKLFPFVWGCGPLDTARMAAAIPPLLGTHDFRSFQNSGTDIRTTVRTLFSLTLRRGSDPPLESDDGDGPAWDGGSPEVTLRFEADGFLKQMVRNLTGLLVACGKGKFDPEDVPALLEARDRRRAPVTAPSRGLTLSRVWYEDEPPRP